MIDNQGRLFGRINLVDAAAVAFLLLLIPLAYGTYLLFRPAKPHIESVTLAAVSKEELRLTSGTILTAKLKVRGSGFNPLLRAAIGNERALAFNFETPNSADVLVGPVGPNDHDVILYDGNQEVARAPGAFSLPVIQPGPSTFIRGVGRFLSLDPESAALLRVGFTQPATAPEFEVLAVGPIKPARSTQRFANDEFQIPVPGMVEREAVLRIRCDSAVSDNPCAVGARGASPLAYQVTLSFAGPTAPFRFLVHEVLPEAAPQRAKVQVRLTGGPHLALLKVGDRDAFLDERGAVISAIGARTPEAVVVTLDLGLDDSRDGWRYRSQRVKPGVLFTLATEQYEATGRIDRVDLVAHDRRGGP